MDTFWLMMSWLPAGKVLCLTQPDADMLCILLLSGMLTYWHLAAELQHVCSNMQPKFSKNCHEHHGYASSAHVKYQ